MQIDFRVWITDNNNEKIFGEGPKSLLIKIDEFGSLRQAATSMGMSYSKAWGIISMIEKQMNISLLDKRIGGPKGGGSTLTPLARDLIRKYSQLETEAGKFTKDLGNDLFKDFYNNKLREE